MWRGKKSIINMKEQHFIIISSSLHNSKFILSSLRSELNPSLFSQYQETAEKSTLLYRGICFCLSLSFLKFPCRVWQVPWAHSSVLHTFLYIRLHPNFLSLYPLKTAKISFGFPAAGNCPCRTSTQNSGAWREKLWQNVVSLHCCLFFPGIVCPWVLVVSILQWLGWFYFT